jgi:hypothetical protein
MAGNVSDFVGVTARGVASLGADVVAAGETRGATAPAPPVTLIIKHDAAREPWRVSMGAILPGDFRRDKWRRSPAAKPEQFSLRPAKMEQRLSIRGCTQVLTSAGCNTCDSTFLTRPSRFDAAANSIL